MDEFKKLVSLDIKGSNTFQQNENVIFVSKGEN